MENTAYKIRKLGRAWEVTRHLPGDYDGTARGALIAIVPTRKRAEQIACAL